MLNFSDNLVFSSCLTPFRIGLLLYNTYALLVFYIGLLLLVAMVAAIYVTSLRSGFLVKEQEHQLLRNNTISNVNVY
jgi:hypothetical protein